MRTITKDEVLAATSNLLGKSGVPFGDTSDWQRFIQHSIDYCWRYHTWNWTLKRGELVEIESQVFMPEDFDYSSFVEIEGLQLSNPGDFSSATYLQYDEENERYEVVGGEAGSQLVYQTEPPALDENVKIAFPSVIVLAVGATVYAKQGENPNRADISQEWDNLHVELDKLVAQHERNSPRKQARSVNRLNRHSVTNSHTGQVE